MSVILHIGTHKTGTTSIQHLVTGQAARFRAAGLHPHPGRHVPHNNIELHVAAMRPDRMSGFKARSGIVPDAAYIASVAHALQAHHAALHPHSTLFLSAEGLSLLRHPDEFNRLKSLLSFSDDVHVIVALRDPADFLASYAAQLGEVATTDPAARDAYNYVGADSWLADYEPRLTLWEQTFPKVTRLDYDAAMISDGSILPAFLTAIGQTGTFTPQELAAFAFRNQSGSVTC